MVTTNAVEACLERLLPADATPLLQRFARLWLECRRGRLLPTFGDFDPIRMPWALSVVFVVDRRDDGKPFYRLVGETMARQLGGHLVNKTAFDVFQEPYATQLDRRWRRCLDEPAACYVHSRHLRQDGVPLQARRILLPVGKGGPAERLIGVSAFDRHPAADMTGTGEDFEILTRWTPISELPPT
jgi:hypothetical protein